MAAIIIDKVDDSLRNEFKSECYKRGLTMREVLTRLMQLELDNHFSSVIKQEEKKE